MTGRLQSDRRAGLGAVDDRPNPTDGPPVSSRHARLVDDLRQPLADLDPARARSLCATICRQALGDLTPALLLLPVHDRWRLQALVSHLRMLLDFACQRGMEGDRLAHLNRWEFELDRALSGEGVSQPVFVAMAECNARDPWPLAALDDLMAAARRLAVGTSADRELANISSAVCRCLIDPRASTALDSFVRDLLRALRNRRRVLNGPTAERRPETSPKASLVARLRSLPDHAAPPKWLRFFAFLALVVDRESRASGANRPLGLPSRLWLIVRAAM